MIKQHHKLLTTLLTILLAMSAFAVQAEDVIEVIPLQYRMADELLPTVAPFVDQQGVLTAKGNQLIIRTSAQNLEQIKTLVSQLDTPLRRLLIEVKQPLSSSREAGQTGASGQFRLPEEHGDVTLERHSTAERDNAITDQQVQVIEGQIAYIKTGQLVPMATKQIRYGLRVETVIEHQDVSSGYSVTPRLSGENVLLEVMPFTSSLDSSGGGIINQQQSATTVSGKLGEWLTIGGIANQQQQGVKVYSTKERNAQQRQVLIKVTELD